MLNRVASLFRRRAFNIDSLTVGGSETPELLAHDHRGGHRARARPSSSAANLRKLVPVVEVTDVTHLPTVDRDLALIRVRCDARRARPRSSSLVRHLPRRGSWTWPSTP